MSWASTALHPSSRLTSTSALDRLANASYEIVIEGTSYRERLSHHQRLLAPKEVIDLITKT